MKNKNRVTTIIASLVAAIVLLFTSASTASATNEGRNGSGRLATKEKLTAEDVTYLRSLPREKRREILTARGWQEIVVPDHYRSYQDLVPTNIIATIYQEALEAAGNGGTDDEILIQPNGIRSPEETLKHIEQVCMDKERLIPFDKFKGEERWVPSPTDLQRNCNVIGGWGTSPGDGNLCDFEPAENGDIVLVKGAGLFPGIFCHAAIVTYEFAYGSFSIGPTGDKGVWWNSRDFLNEYSHASVQRVDTWPLSSSRRQTAANYALKQLGKPYNWVFVDKWRIDAFYCSQLCWAAYYHPSPWYYKIDLDAVPDKLDFGAVARDALWLSWRTSTVTCSD